MEPKFRKKYSKEFKQDAVKLVTDQGYRASEASRNLGVNISVLRRWIKELEKDKAVAFPGNGRITPEQEEMKRLREEVKRLRMEREILKKATAFFANESK
jgi:transposase